MSPAGILIRLTAAFCLESSLAVPFELPGEELAVDDSLVLLQMSTREVRQAERRSPQLLSQDHGYLPHRPPPSAELIRGGGARTRSQSKGVDHGQWPELEGPSAWTWNVPVDVKIVSWTGQFFVTAGIMQESLPQCTFEYLNTHTASFPEDLPLEQQEFVTTDPDTDISDADVVLFYLPYLIRNVTLPTTKRAGQLWVATCGEPVFRPETTMDCSLLNDTSVMSRMDAVASYHGTSEFPTYNDPPYEWLMRQEVPDFASRGEEIVSFAFSDCRSKNRRRWLGAVMDRFTEKGRGDAILSYGHCFHNAEEMDRKDCQQRWFDWWTNRCASRPFKLVGENTIEPWYVTEKLWDAFVEGSIPVYFGPAQVKMLVPPNSTLYAGDYDSPEALADAMLNFSAEDFERFRAWKKLPATEWGGYQEARRNGHTTLLPRLCEAGAAAKQALQQM